MLSPYYTAAHVDAAVAVRAGNTDVGGQMIVAYSTDESSDQISAHPLVVETDAEPKGLAEEPALFFGITLESFKSNQLGTVQIGGVANVMLELETPSTVLECGTLLYPAWEDGIKSSGAKLRATASGNLKPVARVHHHEEHSNVAQARILHGLQYTGDATVAEAPSIQSTMVDVDFTAPASKVPERKRKRAGFEDDLETRLKAAASARKGDEFKEFFGE